MLRFSAPTLLVMSLGLPGASLALGLGDIRVESTLHQPLAAQIDLIAATHADLASLSAGIPDQETFERYGLQRPSFLATTALKVSQDKQGHPVLSLRSTEAFTEPLVTFLVDVHTANGELIREYTLLLDPPDLLNSPVLVPEHGLESTSATPVPTSAAVPQTTAVVTTPKRAVTALDIKPSGHTYTVAARDTLDRIVTIADAHSRSDRHRMMIAIFRANPGAFQSNLNMLRSGAMLRYPSAAELSAISADEANHEFASQMAAWRASDHRLPAAAAVATKPVADAKPDPQSHGTDSSELTHRVESLEKSIDELRRDLTQPIVEHVAVPVAANPAPAPAVTTEQPQPTEEPPSAPRHRGMLLATLAGGLGLALVAGFWFHRRRRSGDKRPAEQLVEQDPPIRRDADRSRSMEAGKTLPRFQQTALSGSYLVEEVKDEVEPATPNAARGDSNWFKDFGIPGMNDLSAGASTADLAVAHALDRANTVASAANVEVSDDTVEHRRALFNPENGTNTTHVVIASGLNEPPPFIERRRNPADVLRQAIEREPDRSDLRLKLLELYYTAAAQNRRAFLEVTRQLAKNEKLASANEWSQIADMGRIIAPDDELFSQRLDDKAVA
jgi:pilus assembly protein FimV